MSNWAERAFGPAEAEYRERVYVSTWGHLAPKPQTTYTGWVVFTLSCFGNITVIDWKLGELDSSPWFYRDLHDFVDRQIDKHQIDPGQVWRWDGTFRVLKNGRSRWSGRTRPCRINMRFGKGPSL